MVVQLQVLSVNSGEMAPSLLLSTESQRFLIDVGDGTQRMCMEHHVRLAKLRHVFLTQLRAHTLGGLPGMVLTVSDTGKDALRVFGPRGTQRFLTATRHFLVRPDFELEGVDLKATRADAPAPTPCYSDDEVLVYAVVTGRTKAGVKRKLHESSASPPNSSCGSSSSSAGEEEEDATRETPPPTADCVSYVIETQPQRGKFLVERAVALGVPKGRLFGQLHQGKSVTLPDGRVVHSADCVSPTLPATGCAVVACPSLEYVDALVRDTSGGFRRYQSNPAEHEVVAGNSDGDSDSAGPDVQLSAVFHLADPDVLRHPKYVAWVQRFGAGVEHVLLSHDGCPRKTVYRASATLQAQLQSVFPRAFPPADRELQDAEVPFSRRVSMLFAPDRPVVVGESLLKFAIAPAARRGFDAGACWKRLDVDEAHTLTAAIRARLEQRDAVDTSSAATTPTPTLAVNGRITFLGTGCAIPSKYRNVTGMYLEIEHEQPRAGGGDAVALPAAVSPDWSGFMLDCGEGSYGQLHRYAGGDTRRVRELVGKLKCIWISHNHADHHLGAVRVLSLRACEAEPVLLIGPTSVAHWLDEYSAVDPTVAGKYRFVDNYCFDELDERFQDAAAEAKAARAWLRDALGVTAFECVPVTHAFRSYALVATFGDALKVAFSGDCRPSERFADRARGAFLMVHEATFEDALAHEAASKKHCTTTEAVDVGRRAGAAHLVLTHFSQRYPKAPVMAAGGGDVLTAVDLLSLRFDELHQPQLVDVCAELMALGDDDDDSNATTATAVPPPVADSS
ncbi:hypothetical protein PybrP1_000976 [[Pythium] brassicae (nom. inval.)]|nr:hypothetical protein PybrP1_000976 [[Pythium] brassicae (nom. inval.)]